MFLCGLDLKEGLFWKVGVKIVGRGGIRICKKGACSLDHSESIGEVKFWVAFFPVEIIRFEVFRVPSLVECKIVAGKCNQVVN